MYLISVVPTTELEIWDGRAATAPANHLRPSMRCGALLLDPDRRRASVGGRSVALTPAEFALLQVLVARRPVAMSKEAILPLLCGSPPCGGQAQNPRLVDVLVCRVRAKLAEAGLADAILTVWGRGYTVRAPDPGPQTRTLGLNRPGAPAMFATFNPSPAGERQSP